MAELAPHLASRLPLSLFGISDLFFIQSSHKHLIYRIFSDGEDIESIVWEAVELEFDDDTVRACITDGSLTIEVLAGVSLTGQRVVLSALHIQGARPNTMGPSAIRSLIRWLKEKLDVDEVGIEGATRTSGAGPGRVPPPIEVR